MGEHFPKIWASNSHWSVRGNKKGEFGRPHTHKQKKSTRGNCPEITGGSWSSIFWGKLAPIGGMFWQNIGLQLHPLSQASSEGAFSAWPRPLKHHSPYGSRKKKFLEFEDNVSPRCKKKKTCETHGLISSGSSRRRVKTSKNGPFA